MFAYFGDGVTLATQEDKQYSVLLLDLSDGSAHIIVVEET